MLETSITTPICVKILDLLIEKKNANREWTIISKTKSLDAENMMALANIKLNVQTF